MFKKMLRFFQKLVSSNMLPISRIKPSCSTLFLYLFLSTFIVGWWVFAFRPTSSYPILTIETSQSLALKTSTLLEELSPLQRDALQRALAGDFPSMLKLIDQWDRDALLLANQGIPGIQRLSTETFLQAHVLGHLLLDSSPKSLRQLNCKMKLEWIHDDSGRLLHIEDHFHQFLPQTYCAASFLLAIAHPHEIIALPKGLRHLKQFSSTDILAKIPADINQMTSERLNLKKPDLAFVAPYSHPPALEALRNQNIALYSLNYVDTVEDIQEALLKVGHSSNHILEAQLLAIFMDASFISIDNRLRALQEKGSGSQVARKFLYLSQRQHYALPTQKCLAGQLMARALAQCPHLSGHIPENQSQWRIPFEQEQILQSAPDVMIISTYAHPSSPIDLALQETQAFKSNQLFYIDEEIQESPTQYIVLAYFDLFEALTATYSL